MASANQADTQVSQFIREYKEKIQSLYRPEAVWLFGSRASGDAIESSDIDLLVISDRFTQMRHLKRRSTFLRETGLAGAYELPVVDPLCYTPDEFLLGLGQPTIVAEAVAGGVKLFGREPDKRSERSES